MPRKPGIKGNFQYIAMELRNSDLEEAITSGPIPPEKSRKIFFQMAFALYAASEHYGIKHIDFNLPNILLKPTEKDELHYGVGAHKFSLCLQFGRKYLAKMAD